MKKKTSNSASSPSQPIAFEWHISFNTAKLMYDLQIL